jgi:RNA polymerase subunit RPABC4/transcription elongation factor Spt4
MSYSCQFCGEIDDTEVRFRCASCGGEGVVQSALGTRCGDCNEVGGKATAVCPTCGSQELDT